MIIETVTVLIADEGKIFKRISNGELLGEIISLGVNDTMKDYKEVDKPPDDE